MTKIRFRTIIILSSPRSGSILLYNALKLISPNSDHLFNLNFWGLAVRAINGDTKLFRDRLKQKFPYIKLPDVFDEDAIFDIWNNIGDADGPILIDKSPFYLDDYKILELLGRYKEKYERVEFIAFIRHPLDAITSQEENGKYRLGHLKIKDREEFYLKRFNNLEKFKTVEHGMHIIKYEDMIQKTYYTIKNINTELRLELNDQENKLKFKVNNCIGRYNFSWNRKVRNWDISKDMIELIKKYNYSIKPKPFKRMFLYLSLSSFIREIAALYYTFSFLLLNKKR